MKTLDRYVLQSLFGSYLICVFLVMSFYVIVDLFNNFDKFADYSKILESGKQSSLAVLLITVKYYLYNLPLIFYNLSPIITLLAAMFTMTRMSKANELIPLKACGIPMYRLYYPFVLFAFLVSLGMVALQESVIPALDQKLEFLTQVQHGRRKSISFTQHVDLQGRIFYIGQYLLLPQTLEDVRVIIPASDSELRPKEIIEAKKGRWVKKDNQKALLLEDGQTTRYRAFGRIEGQPIPIPSEGLVIVTDLDHTKIIYPQGKKMDMLSSASLWEILKHNPDLNGARVTLHSRMTMPLSNILLLFLGLPLILSQQTKNFFLGTALCAVVSGCYYGLSILCLNLGYKEVLNPVFAVWFPVISFGSLGGSLHTLIHT